MDPKALALRVDPERLRRRFEALAQIGATPEGGVHRPALSEAHLAARAWFRREIEAEGLTFRQDGAGNHSAFLACGPEGAPTLLLGSHLDSVPNGGRFDGALGVLAAFEALLAVRDAGLRLPVHLEAIDFTDEEGTLIPLLGSRAVAGRLTAEDLAAPRGGQEAFQAALARAGLTPEGLLTARRPPEALAGYLELHIEQGRRLLEAGADVGVVTAIVGIGSHRLTFLGRADHAGTTAMGDRRDAALGAAEFILAARRTVMDRFPEGVANVGWARFEPGAFNIVPERAVLGLEFRAPEMAQLEALERALVEAAHQAAQRHDLHLLVEPLGKHEPAPMSPLAREAIRQACQDLGLKPLDLPSGAGHDAQSLAPLCPAGMLFVPSVDGASHSPREFTPWEACLNGADALLQAALRLAHAVGGA